MNERADHQIFKELFGTNQTFRDNLFSGIKKRYVIDIIELDEWLVREHEYDIEKHGSMATFITNKFSKEATDFVTAHLG